MSMRGVLAVVAGILAGFAAVVLIALIGGWFFPSPDRIDGLNSEQLVAVFPTLPTGAKVAIILSWFGGALVGATVAKLIARRGWAAWTLAGIFVVYVFISTLVLPMPGWLQAVAVLAPLIGGLLGNHLVDDRLVIAEAPAAAEPEPDA